MPKTTTKSAARARTSAATSRRRSASPHQVPARRPTNSEDTRTWCAALVADFDLRQPKYVAAISHNSIAAFDDLVRDLIASTSNPLLGLPPSNRNSYAEWGFSTLGRFVSTYPSLKPAFAARSKLKSAFRKELRAIAKNMFLYKSPERYAILLGVAHLGVRALAVPYPPNNHWVASTKNVFDKWESYLRVYEQPDKRLKRHPLHLLDRSRLQLVIPADLSCYLYDIGTKKLIAVAIRKFCSIGAIKDWVRRIVYEAAILRRSIRLEDPGSLIQVAFSAGSRAAPAFGMVRNFLSKSDPAGQDAQNREIASLFSYMWLRVKALFPSEVVKNFEEFYRAFDIPRFDPDWPSSYAASATVELPIALGPVRLEDVERGPGLGVFSQGYARAMHFERQGHLWAVSWMANRWGDHLEGGHFYLGAYGVEIEMDDDTAWGWHPDKWHCTGLSNYDPTFDIPEIPDVDHNQQGVAFVSSGRLPRVYQKWASEHGLSGRDKMLGALRELDDPAAVAADSLAFGPEERYD